MISTRAHLHCPTCDALFPNMAPAFIPLLLNVECIPCWMAKKALTMNECEVCGEKKSTSTLI